MLIGVKGSLRAQEPDFIYYPEYYFEYPEPYPQEESPWTVPFLLTLGPPGARALEDIPLRQAPLMERRPRAFIQDLVPPPEGPEDRALSRVVTGPFAERNWEAARESLGLLLEQNLSPDLASRVRFYLGQCSYFLDNPREGLFEFLAIQDRFPLEAQEWIYACLALMYQP